jgi:hypothetical protein
MTTISICSAFCNTAVEPEFAVLLGVERQNVAIWHKTANFNELPPFHGAIGSPKLVQIECFQQELLRQ